jgi:hypothetical protein
MYCNIKCKVPQTSTLLALTHTILRKIILKRNKRNMFFETYNSGNGIKKCHHALVKQGMKAQC